jgi:uncharacterized protein (TIGR02001 family)
MSRVLQVGYIRASIKARRRPMAEWMTQEGPGRWWRSFGMVALLAASVVSESAAQAADWGASLGLTSDYVMRGVTRSSGDPSVQGDVHGSLTSGWFAGLSAATVRLEHDDPISAELTPYAGYRQPIGAGWLGSLSVLRYDYPGSGARSRYAYDEVSLGLAWRNRWFLNAAVLPDASIESSRGAAHDQLALSWELGTHQPIAAGFSFNAGAGYYDLHRLAGVGYPYGNAGVGYEWGDWQLDLSFIGVNNTAKSLYYGERARDRCVASLLYHFR